MIGTIKRTVLALLLLALALVPLSVACAGGTPLAQLPAATPMLPMSTGAPTLPPTLAATSTPAATPTITPIPSPTPRPKTGIADQWLGKADEREKLFDAYVQTIKDGHTLSELGWKPLGTTWENELERSKKRFIEADTKDDVYYALVSLQRSMHDLHSLLISPQELIPASSRLALPFTLAVRGNSRASAQYIVTVSSLPDIKPGFVLKQYQGTSPAQLEYDFLEWEETSSPERLKEDLATRLTRYTSPRQGPAPDPNLPVLVVFTDPDRKIEIQVTVKWSSNVPSEVARNDYQNLIADYHGLRYTTYKDPTGSIVFLVYSQFNYSFRDAELKSALAQSSFPVPPFDQAAALANQTDWLVKFLKANESPDLEIKNRSLAILLEQVDTLNLARYLNKQTAPNLLLDVRGNLGGNINLDLVGLLAAKQFRGPTREFAYVPLVRSDPAFQEGMLTYTDRYMRQVILNQLAREKDALRSQRFPWNCKSAACNISDMTMEPNSNVKKFNLALLSGTRCDSACDNFVSLIKDNEIARVIGLPSDGGATPDRATKEFAFKNGVKFSMVLPCGYAYRPNGESIEGNPAAVEYYLFPEDDYVAKMIDYLKKQNHFK